MATLNTPTELRGYIGVPTTVEDSTLQLYLDAANSIVTDLLSLAGYDADRMKLIELNVAAHFATNGPYNGSYSSGMLESIKVGQSEERYTSVKSSNYGIATSIYGQIAMGLDTQGLLAGLLASNPLKAIFEVY